MRTFSKVLRNPYVHLVILWLILTSVNINKAFHIDDTFHLEAGEYLRNNPLKPMSGLINWDQNPQHLYEFNQPPLFFYLIALFSVFFTPTEISLHLFLSFFTLLALYFFLQISKFLKHEKHSLLLTIFAFNPAFIVNQNLMVDVPLMAIMLAVLYYLLKAKSLNSFKYYFIASILLGFGLLIKYTLLPIVLISFIVVAIRRDYGKMIICFIPIFILVLWSIWNLYEFGTIHISGRPHSGFSLNRLLDFPACLGSVSPFIFSIFYAKLPFKITKIFIFIYIVILIVIIIIFFYGLITAIYFNKFINFVFIFHGYLLIILILFYLFNELKSDFYNYIKTDSFIIILFTLFLSLFIILFSPFVATRHILLIIPLILLFSGKLFNNVSKYIKFLTLSLTIFLGLSLSISDWLYADFYRKMAKEIKIKTNKTVWTCGHWGWQWYSKKSGMKQYSQDEGQNIKAGDYIVFPNNISRQKLDPKLKLRLINKKWEDPSVLTFFSVNNFASLYMSFKFKPPWTLSNEAIDTIFIYRVEKNTYSD